ncbi:MAG: TonB-dependent receptor plug domain-containing protein [Bacteroidota bacterium]|nr:TonB-dependent receptor plug domain-containing protein [Bacteroidota bacterium]
MKRSCLLSFFFCLVMLPDLFAAKDSPQTRTARTDSLSALRIISIREVVVDGDRQQRLSTAFPGREVLSETEIKKLPALLGEPDVLQAVRLMSGVKSVSEGNSGIYVRGGSAGQNLFLLDDMELLNPSHLMGLFSVFNPLTTSSVDVYKGNAPVQLQGRLSSTIAVCSVQPDSAHQGLECNLGNVSSSIAYSRISHNGKWNLITGYRRSYLEMLGWCASPFLSDKYNYFKNNAYAFYDFNGRLHGRLSPKSEISLAWYTGKDRFKFNDDHLQYDAGAGWGNRSALLHYRYRINRDDAFQSFLGYNATFSDFNGQLIEYDMAFSSFFEQVKWKNTWEHRCGNHLIQTGLDLFVQHTIPIDMAMCYQTDTVTRFNQYRNAGTSVYIGDLYRAPSGNLTVYAGIRYTMDATLGPYQYGANRTLTNEVAKVWMNASPIVSLSLFPDVNRSVKISCALNDQNLHLASLSSVPLPMDLWVSSLPRLRPETADQITAGYYQSRSWLDFSIELYAKYMKHLLIFNVVTDNSNYQGFEDQFFQGNGVAYGIDCSLQKKLGAFAGTLNASYSKSLRSFPEIRDGEWFNDKNDRPVDLNLNLTYTLNRIWDFSILWNFASGNTMTLPSGRCWMMGMLMNDYDHFNGYRFPPYHRLDVSANWHLKSHRFRESTLNVSIINVYNRANPYYAYFKVFRGESTYDLTVKSYQLSLFPMIPSISWRFSL